MGIIIMGMVGDGDKSCPRAALYRRRGSGRILGVDGPVFRQDREI